MRRAIASGVAALAIAVVATMGAARAGDIGDTVVPYAVPAINPNSQSAQEGGTTVRALTTIAAPQDAPTVPPTSLRYPTAEQALPAVQSATPAYTPATDSYPEVTAAGVHPYDSGGSTSATISLVNDPLAYTLKQVASTVSTAMTDSTQYGMFLYCALALVSIGWAGMFWFFDGNALPTIVKNTLVRFVEAGLWLYAIQNTWSGIGWFKAIVNAGISLGAKWGGVPSYSVGSGDTNAFPGELLSLGGTLFGEIMGAVTFAQGGIWELLTDTLDGNILLKFGIWVFGLLSASWCVFIMGYAAYRFWWCLVKVYLIAPLSFLQGLGGSRRLSSGAGSYFNGAVVLGVECLMTLMIAGLLYTSIQNEANSFHLEATKEVAQNAWWCVGAVKTVCQSFADSSANIGTLIVVDLTIGLFGWALRDVPQLAADAFAGKMTMTGREATAVLQSMGNPIAKAGGYAGGVLESGARGGTMAGLKTAAQPAVDAAKGVVGAAAMVAVGAATGGVGAAGIASAAGRGGLMGGAGGAIQAGLGKALLGEGAQALLRQARGGEESNQIAGGQAASNGAGANYGQTLDDSVQAAGGRRNAQSQAAGNDGTADSSSGSDDQQRTVNVKTNYDADSGTPPTAPSVDGSDTQTRTTTIDDTLTAATANSGSGRAGLGVSAGGAAGSGGFGGGGNGYGGGGGSAGQNGLAALADELDAHMGIGRMFAQKALYMSAQRPAPPPPPPREDSGTLNLGVGATIH